MTASMADRFAALDGGQRVRLLRRLVEAGRRREIPAVVPPRNGDAVVRLSPAQEDLWVYQSLYPGTAALNLCVAYTFDRPVEVADLERALTVVCAQHDILRMRITGEVGDLRMEFPAVDRFTLERVDLRDGSASLAETLATFSRRPFDLAGPALIRGQFVTVDEVRRTLVLALHHIATDWWSFDVLHTEFVEAYHAVRTGAGTPRDRPPIQYADFAAWQRELEASGVFEAQLDFWRGHLADLPAPMSVGGTGARLPEPTTGPGIAQIPFQVGARTEAAVRAFAREHGSSVYAVLMTAFAVLAHRLTGGPDLVLGTPIANRSAKGLDRVIGYVMNAVPTRWRIGPADSFADLLRRFTAEFPTLLANADVPVGRVVSAVEPERMPGRSPLFQWVFMHLTGQESVRRLREIAEPERIHTGGEHDLVASMRDTEDGIAGAFEIRTDVYPPDVVRWWAESFVVLLDGLLAGPDLPVGDVDLLGPAQRRRLLVEANDTAAEIPPTSLAGLVAAQAVRRPGAVAVESADERLSYAELLDRVDRLADRLRGYGVGAEQIVALTLDRSVAMVVAALAVQRAGGAYLPVDPDHPPARIRQLLADASPVLVITEVGGPTVPPGTGIPQLGLDRGGAVPAAVPAGTGQSRPAATAVPAGPGRAHVPAGPAAVDHRQAGYVIYTSGSTGRPRGVVVSHAGIASLAVAWTRRFELSGDSRVLARSSPGFDMSVGEMCMAFGSGGTLVVPPGGPLTGPEVATVLRERRITCVLLPPAVLASVPVGEYPDLRALAIGGDTCPADLVAAWTAPRRLVFNAYGPTESTVGPTVSDPLPTAGAAPPIGRPIVNSRVYVLDARLRPVPVGVPGELYVAGPGLARGYLRLPAATAERFVADPYAARPGARMYRTGDVVRWRGDGQLDFLGRSDDQVALRGFRIELAEIEAVLAGHGTVGRAVVLLREDSPGQRRLVAYLVPRPGAVIDESTILAHALTALPVFMVPTAFVALDALPVTAHGKLDRDALPRPPDGRSSASRAPATDREAVLCGLFAEVLGVAEVAVDDGFFELGGDSIQAILLTRRAHAAGLGLTLREILAARTPAALARIAGSPAGAAPDPGEGRFRLTPVMHWWRERAGAGALDAFTMSMRFPTPRGLDRERVATALRALVDRHAALRLRLLRHGPDDWELEVPHGPVEVGLTRVDAAGLTDAELPGAVRDAAAGIRLAPETGNVLAAVWFDTGPHRDGWLLVTVHHLAVDGVSWHILRDELTELLATGDTSAAPPGTSYRRWAELLHRAAVRAVDELPAWQEVLCGPEARLAPDRSPADRPGDGRRVTVTSVLSPERTEEVLSGIPAAFRCGPNDVLLTALLAAVVRWRTGGTVPPAGGTGLLVDLEGHGREAPAEDVDVSRTVGWFTTQYPVRLDAGAAAGAAFWQGGAETGQALKRVKEQLRAVPSGGLGYGLLRHLNPDTAPKIAELPTPDLRFNYLGRFTGLDDGTELLGVLSPDAAPLAHLLELDAVAEPGPDGARLVASWSFPAGSLPEPEVRLLAGFWSEALDVLGRHTARAGSGGATSTDFPLVDLTQDQIEALEADLAGPDRAGER